MTNPKQDDALITQIDQVYRNNQGAYRAFVESIQDHNPRAKADKWIAYKASNIDSSSNLEALVYLRSRGHEHKKEIDQLKFAWRRAAREQIDESAKAFSIDILGTGETKREDRMPAIATGNVSNVSVFLLPDFWRGCRIEEALSIDSTMLRTVEWCDIGGFDEWWERLAKSTSADIIHGEMPSFFWLFSMSRSDYAIELMNGALERALDAIELPSYGEPYPWHNGKTWDVKKSANSYVGHLPYASTVVFANMRLRPSGDYSDIVWKAAETLLKTQREDGAWPCWTDDESASVMASAMCIHALALAKPRGWQSCVAKACEWLWSKQERSGNWVDGGFPGSVYLTVLVLDALDLAAGKKLLTFGRQRLKRILLVSVTSNERQAILKRLKSLGIDSQERFEKEFEGHVFTYPVGESAGAEIFMIRTQDQGPASTGIKVSQEVAHLKPDAVLMVGMCMGIESRIEKYDVLIPPEIFSVAHARDTVDGTKPIPHVFRANAMAQRRLSAIVDAGTNFRFAVHQKQLGCGPRKEEDPNGFIIKYLKDVSTDIFGYEMEAEGFYRALEDQRVEALFIKGVADTGDFSDYRRLSPRGRDKKKKESQNQAVGNALDVALKWVEHFIQFPRAFCD